MSLPKVLVLGHRFSSLDPERAVLEGVAEVVDGNELSAAEIEAALGEVRAVMLGTRAEVDAAAVARMAPGSLVVRYGVGLDNVDVAAAEARGIAVANVPDYCVDEVSDHALALVLAANRRLVDGVLAAREGRWGVAAMMDVMGGTTRLATQTVGLLGFGRIAAALARKVLPVAGRVIAHDPVVPDAAVRAAGAEPVAFEALLREADYLSIHCPLTAETRRLIDAGALARMKPTAWIINTARGEIVDEEALADALEEGRLGGVALDVSEHEPPDPAGRLLASPMALVTPHVAWYSDRAVEDLQRGAAVRVRAAVAGG
jgi:D-3-phosphoglycerate dehydrogenase